MGGRRKQEKVGKNAVLAQRALEQKVASEPEESGPPVAKSTRITLAEYKNKFVAFKQTTAKKDGTPL